MSRVSLDALARRLAALAVLALALAALLLGPVGEPDRHGAQLAATSTGGGFTQSNSRDGQPVFTAAGVAPGDSVAGEVTLQNTGTLSGRFSLSPAELIDVPGLHGGALSERLRLSVTDVTSPGDPLTVYDGGLAAMPARDIGVFAPGQARSFRFVAALPDGGDPSGPSAGDNALQGAQASVTYVWTAIQHDEPPPSPQPDEPAMPRPPPSADAGSPPPSRSGRTDRWPPRPRLAVPRVQRIFTRGHLRLLLRSDERARVEVRGRLRAGRSRLPLPRSRARMLAGRTVVLKVRVPARQRRAMRLALIHGRTVVLRIVVTVTDRSGNREAVRRTLRVRAG